MDLTLVHYIKIDENGDRDGDGIITAQNIFHIMGQTWDYTEEEVRAAGFAPVEDSMREVVNGETTMDQEPGDIVKNDDGTFTQEWVEINIDVQEKKDRFMVATRHNMLGLSDWTQMPDSPLNDADKALWATYRQQLRDLPSTIDWDTITSANDIVYPFPPGVVVPEPPQDE